MKKSIIRFTTKMGMTARPNASIRTENLIGAITLAKTILSTNDYDSYTYSIKHKGTIYHYTAQYHTYLGNNKA